MAMSMSQACERCWRRKQKCARDFPCLQCRVASKECVRRRQGSIVDGLDSGPESYVEALKARIAFLKIRVDENSAEFRHNPDMTPANASANTPLQRTTPGESRDDMHSTIQEASYISLSAMAERTDKQRSTTEGLSFKSLLNAALTAGRKDSEMLTSSDNENDNLRAVNDFFFKELCEATYQAYVYHLISSCPFIERSRLDEAYQQARAAHYQGVAVAQASISPEHSVLVYLGLATGIFLSPNHGRHEKDAEALLWCSLEALKRVVDNGDDLPTVHCLIALTVCSLLSDKAGSTWHLLGLAMTHGVASGMHAAKESGSDQQAERAEHVRAVWALYLLDTYVSSALDRPFYLNDSTITMLESVTMEGQIFNLISQARMLRAVRQLKRDEALCDFINLQHLHETTMGRHSAGPTDGLRSYAAGLVEICKYSVITDDLSRKMIITETQTIFTKYLTSLEETLIARSSSATSLDVLLALAIGVIMCRLHAAGNIAEQQAAYQAINVLTLLSIRYNYARGFRDVLMECLITSATAESQQPSARLLELTDRLEIKLPSRIEAIMFRKKSV